MSYDPNLGQPNAQQQQFAFLQQQQARLPNGQPINLSAAQQAQLALHRQGLAPSQQNPNVQAILAQLQAQAQAQASQSGQGWPPQAHLQPQPQTQAPGAPQAGQLDINAVAQYMRAGNQLTPDQMAAFTLQVQNLQQAQRAAQAQQQQQGRPNVGQAPQATQQQQQQAAIAQQLFNQANLRQQQQQQQQQQQAPPQPPQQPPQPVAGPSDPNSGARLPYEVCQPYAQALSSGRAVQQKVTMLTAALKNNFAGGGATGQAPTALTPQLRAQMEKEVETLKQQQQQLVMVITRAVQQYGQPKLNADWNWYQQQAQQNPQSQAANQARLQQAQRQQQAQQHLAQAQHAAQQASQQQANQLAQQQGQPTPHLVNPQQFGMNSQQQIVSAQQQALLQQAQRQKLAAQPPFQLQPPPVTQPLPPQQQQPPPAQQQQAAPAQAHQPPPAAGGDPSNAGMPALHLLQTQLDAPLFMKSLFEVMRKRGEPITGTPYIEGKEVDLYNLYQAVMLSGGSIKVNQQQSWHLIARQLGWDVDTTTPTMHNPNSPETVRLSTELAKMYHQLLRPFEEIWARSLQKQQQQIIERQAQAGGQPQQVLQQQQPNRPPTAPPAGAPAATAPWPGQGLAQGAPNTAALAQMNAQQLAQLGLNPQQIEFMRNQQQQQAKAAEAPAGPVRANSGAAANAVYNYDPTPEQLAQAHTIVNSMRAELGASLQKLKVCEVSQEERAQVMALTTELIPLVKRVQEILPCFLAMSQQKDTCKKMLTMCSFYTDHLKLIQGGQFALNQSGLEQVRDQFHRIWNYVKAHHKQPPAGGALQPNQAQAQLTQEGKGATATTPKEFSLMAQKNAQLRVEDLKPPPAKHRRMSSNNVTSPAFTGSPSTPAQDLESPPAEKVVGRKGAAGRKPAANKGKKAAASPAARVVAAAASPRSPAVAQTSLAVVKEEEPPALKRKRELDEAQNDPDGFIQRALGAGTTGGALASTSAAALSTSIAADLTAHLPFDFEPVLPPLIPESDLAPLSFVNAFEFSTSPELGTLTLGTGALGLANVTSPAWMDGPKFTLDPTLSGGHAFDETNAPTPDLVPASSSDSLSPASVGSAKEKDTKMDAQARLQISQPFMTPSLGLDEDSFAGGMFRETDVWGTDKSGMGPQDGLRMPEGFGWSGEGGRGGWEIYPTDSYGL